MAKNTPDLPRKTPSEIADPNLVSAINQMFAEFELVFHNQYQKAFSTKEKEDWAKKLWYTNLKEYSAQQILEAAHKAIKESEYLPTVRGVLKYLEAAALQACGLPDVRNAYLEACNASHPKAAFRWSHPAVYQAGHDCGWLFLESSPEKQAFPIFQQHYKALCERVRAGEQLTVPVVSQLPEQTSAPMNKNDRKQALKQLRKQTGL